MIRVPSAKDPESIRFELGLYNSFSAEQNDILLKIILGVCKRAGCEYGGIYASRGDWHMTFYTPEHPKQRVNIHFGVLRFGKFWKSSVKVELCCDAEFPNNHTILLYRANVFPGSFHFRKTDPLFRPKIRILSNWIKTTLEHVNYQWSMPDYKAQYMLGIICNELEKSHGFESTWHSDNKIVISEYYKGSIYYFKNSFFRGPCLYIQLDYGGGSAWFYYKDSPNKICRRIKKLVERIKRKA